MNTDHVAAVMTADDVADVASTSFLAQHNIPVIGAMGFDANAWGKAPNFYPVFTQVPGTLEAQVLSATTVKSTHFGAVVCQEVAARLQAQQVFEPAAKAAGMAWSGVVTAAASAPTYTSQCLASDTKQDGLHFDEHSRTVSTRSSSRTASNRVTAVITERMPTGSLKSLTVLSRGRSSPAISQTSPGGLTPRRSSSSGARWPSTPRVRTTRTARQRWYGQSCSSSSWPLGRPRQR